MTNVKTIYSSIDTPSHYTRSNEGARGTFYNVFVECFRFTIPATGIWDIELEMVININAQDTVNVLLVYNNNDNIRESKQVAGTSIRTPVRMRWKAVQFNKNDKVYIGLRSEANVANNVRPLMYNGMSVYYG